MSDEKKIISAQKVYNMLCASIERRGWSYDREDDDLFVHFIVTGDDLPMHFFIMVDTDSQLIRLLSPLSIKFSKNNLIKGAVATCAATFPLVDGCFNYNIADGSVSFRMTAFFIDSLISEELFQYLISCSITIVDEYNDKFLAIERGALSLDDFIGSVSE